MNAGASEIVAPTTAADEITIGDVIGLFAGGKWVILAFLLLGLLCALAYNFIATPIYSTDALVQLESKNSTMMSEAMTAIAAVSGISDTPVPAEVEIIKSRTITNKTVESLGLNVKVTPNYFPVVGEAISRRRIRNLKPADPMFGLRKYAWGGERVSMGAVEVPPILVDVPMRMVAGENGTYSLYGRDVKILDGKVGEIARGDHRFGPIEIFVRDLVARPGTEFTLVKLGSQAAANMITKSLVVSEKVSGSRVIGLQYQHTDPVKAAAILNELITVYQRQNVERRSAEAQQTLEFLQGQLPKLKQKVDQSEAVLNKFRLDQGSADLTKETDLVLQETVTLETQRLALQQQREEAVRKFTPEHPVVQAIDAQIRQINIRRDKVSAQVKDLPETQQQLLSLTRDVTVNTELYNSLLNSFQELQIAKAGTVGNVRIVDYAVPPLTPSKPQKAMSIAFGLLGGLVFGLAIVLILRVLHRGIDDPAIVESKLGLPTYATVPFVDEQKRLMQLIKRGSLAGGAPRVLAAADSSNLAIEALRSLRTSLNFALLEAENNVLMLTGPTQGLGKSFVSMNLGAVLALSGKRVVVVDADLRLGHLHDYVADLPVSPGVSDYVAGKTDVDSVLRPANVENLYLVPRGTIPPNPAELLLHERFAELVRDLSAKFDHVILDTPPILAVTDAAVVGQLAGCTLLVLKAGEHPLRAVEESLRRLRQVGVQVRGSIFNLVGMSGKYGYSYGYNYGYTYGYSYKQAYKA